MTWYDGGPAPDPRSGSGGRSGVVRAGAGVDAGVDPGAGDVGAGDTGAWVGAGDTGVGDVGWLAPEPPGRLLAGAWPAVATRTADAVPPEVPEGGAATARGKVPGRGTAPAPPDLPEHGGAVPRPVSESGRAGVAAGSARLRAAAEAASADRVLGPDTGPPWVGDEPEPDRPPRLADVVRWRLPPRTAVIAVAALALVGGVVAVRAAAQPTGEPVAIEEPAVTAGTAPGGGTAASADASAADAAPDEEVTVWVHVVGQVASPGVVALPAGSRVGDAVTAAGGALPDADLAGLNLAAVVQDGAQIRVPAPGEEPAPAADGSGDQGSGGASGSDGLVDVNTAGSAELQTLPGIGPVLAERIVAWRAEHGPFDSVDALLDVSGIGPAVLGQIRALVRV